MTATDPFDADRLDAWLEGNPFPTASLNGHSDTQPDLVGTAQRFHADAGSAERGLPVPTRAIWEDVMQRTAGLQLSPPVIPTSAGDAGHHPPPETPRRPVAFEPPHQRGLWITTVSLVVVAMFAIAAVAYLANRSNENLSGITNTPEAPNLAANFSSSPESGSNTSASPVAATFEIITPDQVDCSTIERRSNDEVLALQSNPGEFPDRSYGPSLAANEEDAMAIAAVDPYVSMCHGEWRSLASPRLIADAQAMGYPYGLFPGYYLDRGMTLDDLSSLLQTLVVESGVTDASEILIPTDAPDSEDSWYAVINPDHVRLFPDGRLGAIQTWVIPASFGTDQTAYQTNYVFYSQDPTQDGKWVLDETLPICVGECDEYWAAVAEGSWFEDVPNLISAATPAASPVSVDESEWLIDPQKIVCSREFGNWTGIRSTEIPGTINDYLPLEIAANQAQLDVARTYQAVAGLCFDELDQEAYFADDLWSFPLRTEGIPVTQAELDIARSISEVINTGDAMDFVHATDAPFELIQPVVSHSAILPSSVVKLPDGRYAAPLHIVVEANSPDDLRPGLDETGGLVVSSLVVFAPVADGYVMEGYLPICLGNCDGYWDTYEISDATDAPSATIEASPEADGIAMLPALPPDTETPEPSTELDGAHATEVDIQGWLNSVATFVCPTPGSDETQEPPLGGWPTDLVIAPENYIPFGTPSVAERAAIENILLTMSASCDSGVRRSPDFEWMPGPSVAVPSDEQIAAAQEISTALPDQDPDSYLIIAPTAELQADQGTSVFFPGDLVRLADGRIGLPLRIAFPSEAEVENYRNAMATAIENDTAVLTVFFTFVQSGEDWLIDEMILVCIGECDRAWEMMADPSLLPATPQAPAAVVATPQPITAEECDVAGLSSNDVSAIVANPGEEPDRSYVPVGPADPVDAVLATQADRGWEACSIYGSIGQKTVLQTPWLTATGPESDPNLYAGTAEEAIVIIEERRALSEGMLSDDQFDYVRPSGLTEEEMVESYGSSSMTVPDPGTAYGLEDGRIAIAQIRLEADDSYIFAEEFEPIGSYFTVPVHILALDPDSQLWLVDEVIWLTGGDVDDRIMAVREWEATMLEQAGMSPATPEATPAVDGIYEPITAEECDVSGLSSEEVSAIVGDPGEEPERSYVPVGPADPEAAMLAIEADRAWMACSTYGSIGQKTVLQTPWLTATGPETDLLADSMDETITRINQRQPLSDGMLSADQLDYYVSSGQTEEEMNAGLLGYSTTVPHPNEAFVLADGRIAIPQLIVMPADSYMFTEEWEPYGPYYSIPVHILAKDPETQIWLVDEVIWLAGGDLDELILSLRDQETAMLEQAGMSPATPEATPAGGS